MSLRALTQIADPVGVGRWASPSAPWHCCPCRQTLSATLSTTRKHLPLSLIFVSEPQSLHRTDGSLGRQAAREAEREGWAFLLRGRALLLSLQRTAGGKVAQTPRPGPPMLTSERGGVRSEHTVPGVHPPVLVSPTESTGGC